MYLLETLRPYYQMQRKHNHLNFKNLLRFSLRITHLCVPSQRLCQKSQAATPVIQYEARCAAT
jgi:hypothetical protein